LQIKGQRVGPLFALKSLEKLISYLFLEGIPMKKTLVMTVTLAGLGLAACAKKESYLAGKGAGGGGGGGELSMQQKAAEVLSQDKRFTSVSENALSEKLKNNISSKAFEIKRDEANSTIELSVLDKNSKNCVADTKTYEGFDLDALRKGIKINGVGRVQCVESQGDCNDLLLIVEKSVDQFAGGSMPNTTLQASTAVFLSKDEAGVYKPVKTEDTIFANAMTLEEKMQECLAEETANSNGYELQNPRVREALKAKEVKDASEVKNTELSNPRVREALKINENQNTSNNSELSNPRIREALKAKEVKDASEVKNTELSNPRMREALKINENQKTSELSNPRIREALKANAGKGRAEIKNTELANPRTRQGLKDNAPLEVVDPVSDIE
jgi:uncharacterized spore protein YtfJ